MYRSNVKKLQNFQQKQNILLQKIERENLKPTLCNTTGATLTDDDSLDTKIDTCRKAQ